MLEIFVNWLVCVAARVLFLENGSTLIRQVGGPSSGTAYSSLHFVFDLECELDIQTRFACTKV